MTPQGPPYYGIDWDDELEKTPLATAATTRGMLNVERWLKANASAYVLSIDMIDGFHRVAFEGVFPEFAGKRRGPTPQYHPFNVTFGNRRSVPYLDVPAACLRLASNIDLNIKSLDLMFKAPRTPDFDEAVLKVAAYTHCEIVRIHPYRNGNGRTARMCVNYFAWRYSYRPLSIANPGGDYIDANRSWMDRNRIEHMMDVFRPN